MSEETKSNDTTDDSDTPTEAPVHPLQRSWCIWEHRVGGKSYHDNLDCIAEFDTVEGFWKYWRHIPPPSDFFYTKKEARLTLGERDVIAFSVFEKGVEPCWEDPKNTNGGEWRIRKFKNFQELDYAWFDAVLLLIGESYDPALKLVGVRVVDSSNADRQKQLYNVEVWFEDTKQQKKIEKILQRFNLENTKFYYREHKTSFEK